MRTKFIVITGGPGAGKTAVLEIAKRRFTASTAILPEAASLIFSGGFWRLTSTTGKRAAQRAIFHVQSQMERLIEEEGLWQNALCDRGTLDGLAFWPGPEAEYWSDLGTTKEAELKKYAAVIHMRTPSEFGGYNYQNPLRIEGAGEAQAIDRRIQSIWSVHPHYVQVSSFDNFFDKAAAALGEIQKIIAGGTA